MSDKPWRYVKLSSKIRSIERMDQTEIEIRWKVIGPDVSDPRILEFGDGFFAVVEETHTVYIFQVKLT